MKKFLRNLFSGYFLVLFILLIELGIVIFLQFGFDSLIDKLSAGDVSDDKIRLWVALAYIFIKIIVFLVALTIFFKIIKKEEAPDFKIPWIIGMLLLPFFFSVLFIIFGNHGLRKKDKRIIDSTHNAYREYFKLSNEQSRMVEKELGNSLGTFKYINNITELGVHKNNRVTYYKTGEEFFPELMESLKKAQKFIFMEFFIIADGSLWSNVVEILKERASQGVDVRIIYDDMGCGGTISSKTPKILKEYNIQAFKFHPFRPILSGVYNNRDHRKIVIIDHQMAYTGGMNLADEYANIIERFGYWKDTMVKIEGSAINNLLVTFLQNFNLCTGIISDYHKYLAYDYEKYDDEGYVMPFGDGPGGIDDALIGEQTYINMLHHAKEKVYISTPYLIPTYQLLDSIRNAALRGVEVNLIFPGIPDKKIAYIVGEYHFKYLLDAGVNIYLYSKGFNHMKTVLVDDELAFVGTINFDYRSLVHHFECGTLLYKNNCMKDIKEDFETMISESKLVPKNFKLKKGVSRICSLIKLIEPVL